MIIWGVYNLFIVIANEEDTPNLNHICQWNSKNIYSILIQIYNFKSNKNYMFWTFEQLHHVHWIIKMTKSIFKSTTVISIEFVEFTFKTSNLIMQGLTMANIDILNAEHSF